MAKEIQTYIKLQVKGGQANPAPPIGPALGSKGVNIMEFCKQFNARTKEDAGKTLPVIITVYTDKSFEFVIKTPPALTYPVVISCTAPTVNISFATLEPPTQSYPSVPPSRRCVSVYGPYTL